MCVCVLERDRERGRETAQRKTKTGNRHAEKLELTGETQGREGERDEQAGGGRGLLVTADIPETASRPIAPAGWPLGPFKGGRGEHLVAPGTQTHFATHSAGDEQVHPGRGTRLGRRAWLLWTPSDLESLLWPEDRASCQSLPPLLEEEALAQGGIHSLTYSFILPFYK